MLNISFFSVKMKEGRFDINLFKHSLEQISRIENQWRRQGVAWGQLPPPLRCSMFLLLFLLFFCLSSQSVMAMIVPVPHYEMCVWKCFEFGKNKCVGFPPPPPPPLSDFFRAGAKFSGSHSSSETFLQFCPPPPPPLSKHPGAAPVENYIAIRKNTFMLFLDRWRNVIIWLFVTVH